MDSLLWARCPSRHPTNSVKAPKETQSTDTNQWPGLILSSSATRLLTERVFLPSCRLSDDSTRHKQDKPRQNTQTTMNRKHWLQPVAGYVPKLSAAPGSRTRTRSPIPVLTGLSVGYHYVLPLRKPPPLLMSVYPLSQTVTDDSLDTISLDVYGAM